MIEFFNIERIILLAAWVSFVYVFFRSYKKHTKDIYDGLRGSDGEWQPIELATWYWFQFFPYLFFMTLLIVITGDLNDLRINLMITTWTALNAIFAVSIAGKQWGNGNNKKGEG